MGCGSGEQLKFMQDMGWCVEGVEVDPPAVRNAKIKGLDVRLGTMEAQKYPDDHFHAVTMSHVIEHVHDPLGLLRECYRFLQPGGRLVVVTPNAKSRGHKMFKQSWRGLEPPRHLHVFTPEALRDLAERSGLSKVHVFTTVHAADFMFKVSLSIQRTGGYDMDGPPHSRATRIWALGMQIVEWALMKMKPELGEEIVLIGVKQ